MSANVSQNYYVLGQAPLDAKIVFKNKQAFIDYTLNNEFFAFNFYKGMLVYLQEEEILCIWEFAYSPIYEENEKILPNNFIYPLGTIYNGLDYSEKAFNLIEIPLNKSNLGQWDLDTNDEKTLTIVVDENTISNVFVPEQITQLWPNAEKISFIDGNIQGIKFQGKQIEYFEEFSLLDWDQLTYEIWNPDAVYIQNAKMKIVMIGENIDYTQYENRILANSFTEAKIIHEIVSAKNKNSIYFLNEEDSFDILIVDKFFVVKKASDFFAKKDASNLSAHSVSWRSALDLYSRDEIDSKTSNKYNDEANSIANDIIKLIDINTGENVNYREVITWYDGTPMTDLKVDGDLYSKRGSKYYRRVINKDGELFLEKDTMAQMRYLTQLEILYLKAGVYKGVRLNGYYVKGDTPYSINYYPETTSLTSDDVSVITLQGNYKLVLSEKEVYLSHFGGVSDGNPTNHTGTDNKVAIEKARDYISRTKSRLNINGKYATSPFTLNVNDLDIVMFKDSWILGYSTMGLQDKLIRIGGNNIEIYAYGAFVSSPSKSEGEWNHNIQIDTGKNVTIKGLKVLGSGGDGIYIGNITEDRPTNILLEDVHTDNARRNGISLVNGINVKIVRPVCENAVGTLPMAGIDIEPNSYAAERLEGISVIDPITRGNGGYGVLVTVANYVNEAEKNTDINIVNHTSIGDNLNGDRGGFGIVGTGHTYDWSHKLNGTIKYTGQVFRAGGAGFIYHSHNPNYAPISDVDIYIEDCADSYTGPNNFFKSGVLIWGGVGDVNFPNGNLNLKVRVRDTRPTPKTFTDIYIYNPSQDIINVNIEADVDNRTTFGSPMVVSTKDFKGNVKFKGLSIEATVTTSANATINRMGCRNILKNSISWTLPLSSKYIGQTMEVVNGDSIYKNIVLTAGDKWDITYLGNNSRNIILNTGQTLKLKATEYGWLVIETNDTIRYQFTNGLRPPQVIYVSAIPTDGTFLKGDIAINLNVVDDQPIGWQCSVAGTPGTWKPFAPINLGNATTSRKGFVNQAEAVTDSAAADIAGMNTKFNELLTKLRTAGILKP